MTWLLDATAPLERSIGRRRWLTSVCVGVLAAVAELTLRGGGWASAVASLLAVSLVLRLVLQLNRTAR